MRLFTLVLITLLATPAMSAFAEIGEPLPEVLEQDFFTFFNLGEESREGDIATFKPRGGDFRELVTVRVHLGDEERIERVELDLARSFVDDGFKSIFARDIGKSMLRQFLPEADAETAATLIREIEHGQNADSGYTTHHLSGTAPEELPAEPSPGYQVWLGTKAEHSQDLTATTLRMQSTDDILTLTLERKP